MYSFDCEDKAFTSASSCLHHIIYAH